MFQLRKLVCPVCRDTIFAHAKTHEHVVYIVNDSSSGTDSDESTHHPLSVYDALSESSHTYQDDTDDIDSGSESENMPTLVITVDATQRPHPHPHPRPRPRPRPSPECN
jgi:hypothetical protein